MNRYLIMIEEGVEGYGAYAPDLLGCIAVAKTKEEVIRIIQKEIEIYLKSLEQKGESFPIPFRVQNSNRKTDRERNELFSAINPNWEPKSHIYRVSYVCYSHRRGKYRNTKIN